MCITEYNEAETMQMFREEGRVEGRVEGRAEGRADTIIDLVRNHDISIETAAEYLNISVDEVEDML